MADVSAYAVLGIQKGCTEEEIKRAYVELVKKYDPERHTERFMVVQSAYNKLREVPQRAREDIHTLNVVRSEFLFLPEEKDSDNHPPTDSAVDAARAEYRSKAGDAKLKEALIGLLLRRARAEMLRKQWPDAIRDWKEALELDPTNTRARQNLLHGYISLATTYALHGLDDEAISLWEQAIAMNPDNTDVMHNLALGYERMKKPDRAGRYWAETVKRWTKRMEAGGPDSDYLRHCIIEAHRHHGEQIEIAGKMGISAVPGGSSGASSSPASTTAAPKPAVASPAAGGTAPPPVAAPSSPNVPRPAPEQPPAVPVASSANRFKRMLELNPNDTESRFQFVHALMEEGRFAEAIEELNKLAVQHPKNIEVLNLLGWSQLNSGQVDAAFNTWKKGMTIDPKDATLRESEARARLMVGKQLRDKGLFTHALVHFKNLLRLLPNSAEAHMEIALTYDMKGDVRSAQAEYQAVLNLDPKNKLARKAIQDLKMKR